MGRNTKGGATPALSLTAHPNPTSGPVTIFGSFPALENQAPVVEIYDVAGKRVTRWDGVANSSSFSFQWDGRDERGARVASGLYFARLRIAGEVVTRKFVVVR